MANSLGQNPLVFDSAGATSWFDFNGSAASIFWGGNTAVATTILLHNVKNQLFNKNFGSWDGGTAVAPTGWTLTGAGAAVAQESTLVDTGDFSANVTRSGADVTLEQDLLAHLPVPYNDIAFWRGKTIVAGARVRATVGARALVETFDGTTTTPSSAHSGGSAFESLAIAPVTVNTAAISLTLRCIVKTGDTAAQFDTMFFGEAKPWFQMTGAIVPVQTTYKRRLRFDGLFLETLTGGVLQVQI